jgi:hypothetical protein
MQFVYDKVKYAAGVASQPQTRLFKDRRLHAAHEHDIEHGIIRDQDIRRLCLHAPTVPTLGCIRVQAGKVIAELGLVVKTDELAL